MSNEQCAIVGLGIAHCSLLIAHLAAGGTALYGRDCLVLTARPRLPLREMLLIGLWPSPIKKLLYRLKGYRIGTNVHLGLGSVICGDDVEIGRQEAEVDIPDNSDCEAISPQVPQPQLVAVAGRLQQAHVVDRRHFWQPGFNGSRRHAEPLRGDAEGIFAAGKSDLHLAEPEKTTQSIYNGVRRHVALLDVQVEMFADSGRQIGRDLVDTKIFRRNTKLRDPVPQRRR